MNYILNKYFKYKKPNYEKLAAYGFVMDDGKYVFHSPLEKSNMIMNVSVDLFGEIDMNVWDSATEEPFTLIFVESAIGAFVGDVRTECEEVLSDIAEKCFETEIFKSEQAKQVIEFIRSSYDTTLEFLWKKCPDIAVMRRQDNDKWYGIIFTLSLRKLGLDSDDIIDIIDLRIPPDELENAVDYHSYFKGYHMNKKHWVTILLDGSVSIDEIFSRIKDSYSLAK